MCLGGGNSGPAPAPVIERQPFKTPAPFANFSDPAAAEARRRFIAGVVTGAQGVTDPASTTKGVKNQALGGGAAPDALGGGSASAPGAPSAAAIAPNSTPPSPLLNAAAIINARKRATPTKPSGDLYANSMS